MIGVSLFWIGGLRLQMRPNDAGDEVESPSDVGLVDAALGDEPLPLLNVEGPESSWAQSGLVFRGASPKFRERTLGLDRRLDR